MSSRIEQVLEVLQEVKKEYLKNQSQHPISSLRKKAVQRVATKRDIDSSTVADKYIRQLKPYIQKTSDGRMVTRYSYSQSQILTA